jgi:hypothetical protein
MDDAVMEKMGRQAWEWRRNCNGQWSAELARSRILAYQK